MNSIQVTIFSSLLSAIIALSVVFINKYFESKKSKKDKYDTVKKYANPIIFATEQLAWRLTEILRFKGVYLLPDAPMNGFFKYKFDSTVYRLNAVLGWIKAAQKEQSYIEGTKIKHHEKIQTAIHKFQTCLADGAHVEVSILDELSKLYNLDTINLSENERSLIGVELEKIVFKYIPDNIKKNAAKLLEDKQIEMLIEIMDFICGKSNQRQINHEVIREKRATAINEISREFCWIYRDWQSAIGEEMIKDIENANRRFDVIGFAEFQTKRIDNIWLKKTEDLFTNLDISVDDRFDSRVDQLKKVFDTAINLIIVLKTIVKKQESISESSITQLIDFNNALNNNN